MALIVYYVVFMVIGDVADYFIGLVVEHVWPGATQASLIVFLTLYFLFLWVSWVLAVWMTKPEVPARARPEPHDVSMMRKRSRPQRRR